MLKNYTAKLSLIILFAIILSFTAFKKVQAYENSSYTKALKIGLVSMSSQNISITLKGDYTLNGEKYNSGSILNIQTNGTSLLLNGNTYSEISLIPVNSDNFLTIKSTSTSANYMGSFTIKSYNDNVLPINIIDIESYLKGVVGYEMSNSFPIEALKAQAVAARNYALSRIGWESAKGYDFDDTIRFQVYKGFNSSFDKVITAVDETKGQILLYNNKLVEALYSAWHGGFSEDSENVWENYVPYLRSVQDPYENDPWPEGNKVFTNNQIQTALLLKGYLNSYDTFVRFDLDSITKYKSGRVSQIKIVYKPFGGNEQIKTIAKDEARTFLSFPSSLYTVSYDPINSTYTFSGKGYGHGLGMSQIGAKNRAAAGQTYEEILKFYFQNTYLHRLTQKTYLSLFTQNANSLPIGNTISFSAKAEGGKDYLYKYIVKNESNVVFTRDYATTSTLDFTPNILGNYTVEVYVKSVLSTSNYEDSRSLQFTVYNYNQVKAVTAIGYFYEGKPVTFNASKTDSSPSNIKYKYEVFHKGNLVTSNSFASFNSFTFTPSEAGDYIVKVYGKDPLSPNSYDSIKEFKIAIKAKPLSEDTDPVTLQNTLKNFGINIPKDNKYGLEASKSFAGKGVISNMTYSILNDAIIEKEGNKINIY